MSNKKSYSGLGGRFFLARQHAKMTQHAFAATIGIKANTLSDIENNKYVPSDAVVISVCVRYAINSEWLLTGQGEMFTTAADAQRKECCIPKDRRPLIDAALEVLDSATMHAKALEQNILAFQHAVRVEKKITELIHRVQFLEEDKKQRDQELSPNLESSGGGTI